MTDPLRLFIVGLGRAGTSLGLAAVRAGHDVVGVVGRSKVVARAALLDAPIFDWETEIPACDLIVVAVRDDVIAAASSSLAPLASRAAAAVHLSGLTSVTALDPLREVGLDIGGFHPLQTMPNPQEGSIALAGASIGITADPPLDGRLNELALSIGARPFALDDSRRALYHAAAAAASNYVLTALGMAEEIFDAAGVPFVAARALVDEVVANAFELGAAVALTGPIARGDLATVAAQISAVESMNPRLALDFKALGRATARLAGADETMKELLL
ncbi:MAG: DUF2520 domain-containing protein [Acidimicrobiia bacterium]|nr:DUF2520 domain-containing protein [Acidimicrobiia bacterium]